MIFTTARLVLAAALAFSLPASAAAPAPATATIAKSCATGIDKPADFAAHQAAAMMVLAQYGGSSAQTRPAPMQMRAVSNPAAEIAQVRNQAQRVTMSSSARARAEALQSVAAVANYRGSDPAVMNRLLARVDRAADAMHANLSRQTGGTSAAQTGAFKCNADRLECKQACSDAKGKACCCGCGVSYVACLVLG